MQKEKSKSRVALFFAIITAVLLTAIFLTRTDAPELTKGAAPAALPVEQPVSRTIAPPSEVSPNAGMPQGEEDVVPAPAKAAAARPAIAAASTDGGAPAPAEVPAAEEPAPIVAAAVAPAAPLEAVEPNTARVEIKFRETLGGLNATMIEVQIDGVTVVTKEATKGIGVNLSWPLTDDARVKMGVRKLDVIVKLVGDSDAFPYLAGYSFTMTKSANIPIQGPTVVRLEATTMGNVTDDWTKRVNLEFHVEKALAKSL
jgi:hypothetical protein